MQNNFGIWTCLVSKKFYALDDCEIHQVDIFQEIIRVTNRDTKQIHFN